MQIERIELFLVDLPARSPYVGAGFAAFEEGPPGLCSVLARFSSGGAAGWGEAVLEARPNRRAEWADGAFALLERVLAPRLAGRRVDSAASLHERLSVQRGWPAAVAALDGAWWSLKAAQENASLHSLVRKEQKLPPLDTPPEIPVAAEFASGRTADEVGTLLDGVREAYAAGFSSVKLHVRPGWDVSLLRAVRAEHPSQNLQLDCGGAFRLQDHLEMFCRLDDFFLTMVEEPFAAGLWEHARLQETISTAVCLGESLVGGGNEPFDLAAEAGACRVVHLDPTCCGGLTPTLSALAAARDAGLGVWAGGGAGIGVAAEAAAALAALPGFAFPADLLPPGGAVDGRFRAPLAPFRNGAGIQVVRPSDARGEPLEVEAVRAAARISAVIVPS